MKEKQLPDYFGKVPPQDVSMEKAVLGALLIDGNMDVFNVVSKIVTEDSFYTESHRIVFSALKRLHDRFAPVDLLTVSHEIKTIGKNHLVDELYLSELTDAIAIPKTPKYLESTKLNNILNNTPTTPLNVVIFVLVASSISSMYSKSTNIFLFLFKSFFLSVILFSVIFSSLIYLYKVFASSISLEVAVANNSVSDNWL